MGWVFLSHVLSPSTPGYGGSQGFKAEKKSQICLGHSSNSQQWEMSNHIGTHIDAPLHFAEGAASIDALPASFWIFQNVALLDHPMEPGEILYPDAVAEKVPQNTDLILLRTGFEKRRTEDVFWAKNPGLSPQLGAWLRERRPSVRCIGFDFISVTSYADRPLGREAHRAFLDPKLPGNPILAIEDMALDALKTAPARVIVSPLLVKDADGSPVTVLAEMN